MPRIPALERLKEKDHLSYTVNSRQTWAIKSERPLNLKKKKNKIGRKKRAGERWGRNEAMTKAFIASADLLRQQGGTALRGKEEILQQPPPENPRQDATKDELGAA